MSNAKKLLEIAQAFNKKKAWQKTIDALSEKELKTLKSADLYAEKAQAYYRLKQYEDSKAAAEKTLVIEPNHAKGNCYQAHWFADNQNIDKAIELYIKAIQTSLDFADPYNGIGIIYADKKEYEKAIEWYQKSVQIDPDYVYPYNNLGNVYGNKKEYEKAIEWYEKAVQIDPAYTAPYNNLGNVHYNKNEYEKAIEWYQKAIQIDPADTTPYNGLGNAYYNKREYEKAIEWYQKAIQIDPAFLDPYNNLGNVHYNKKEYEKAIEWYQKAIQIDPAFVDPYNNLGNVYYNKKEYEKAIELYQKAIQIDPDYANAYYNLGLSFKNIENSSESKKAFEKFLALTPDKEEYLSKQAHAYISELEKLINYGDYYETINKLINEVKRMLLVQAGCITHYTSLSAARFLILNGSKFRLSEGAFLNDTSEGRELFRYLNFHITAANHHETVAEPFSRKPFIGSFVDEKKYDDLTLWRMYGKENKEEARGCAITLNMKQFIDQVKEEIQDKDHTSSINRGDMAIMDKEFVFYQVVYRNEEKNQFILPGTDLKKNDSLNNVMLRLKKAVEGFNAHKKDHKEEQRDAMELLNEIAYLFKTAEYQYEHEIRLVIEKTGFEVQFNLSEEAPKAYIEIGDIRKAITKITLGPKIERAAEWAAMFYYSLQKDDLKPDIFISRLPFK